MLSRRSFLTGIGSAALVGASQGTQLLAEPAHGDFDFVFLTDTHLEPELDAARGCALAFTKLHGQRLEFALQGGDHVFDTMRVPKERATGLFDLYTRTEQDLGMKVWHTCGNHDCFAISSGDPAMQSDPLYGKKMFEERFGRAYYSFDHKGVHFVVLDSVQPLDNAGGYTGHIDDAQLAWLRDDLSKAGPSTPIVVATHIPLVTAMDSYGAIPNGAPGTKGSTSVGNSEQVIPLFAGHNVLGVLQGHTHIWETVTWRGIPYITGGAVSGNWWKGTHLGTPEGYTLVSLRGGKMSVRYETYGFHSIDPHNT